MASDRDPPWSEHEKVALLAELLKAAPIRSEVLLRLIQDYQIAPRWADIPLPPGRSLNSCRQAFDALLASRSHEYSRSAPLASIHPGPMTDPARKRPFSYDISTPLGRNIQPRPSFVPPGEVPGVSPYASSPPTGDEHTKRRRGRPTKAEAQAKAEAAWARGETYPPPAKARKAERTSVLAAPEIAGGPVSMPGSSVPPPVAAVPTAMMAKGGRISQSPNLEAGSEASPAGQEKQSRPSTAEQREEGARGSVGASGAGALPTPLEAGSAQLPDFSSTQTVAPSERRQSPMTEMREGLERESEEIRRRTTTPHSFKETVGM